jgi:leader peptidase (prepilin peptidase)/N-methyltransferase
VQLIPWFILFTLWGACVGSFLNVVVYRLPRGKNLVTPRSACPRCGHQLAWFDNIPVLGWIILCGRCRYCKAPISAEYPIVEAFTALMFGALFWTYYLGGATNEAMAASDFADTWPVYVAHLLLIGALVAATRIDAELYIIPLRIPWLVLAITVVMVPAAAHYVPAIRHVVPPADGAWFGASVGGVVGWVVAVALLRFGILPLSFAEDHLDEQAEGADAARKVAGPGPETPAITSGDAVIFFSVVIAAMAGASFFGAWGAAFGFVILWWAALINPWSVHLQPPEDPDANPEQMIHYPRIRREALKELLFIAIPVAGMILGSRMPQGWIASMTGLSPGVGVLGQMLLGFLVGAGLIWVMRILGTLGFGKEAMGLGDVHLMGAIGAVLGPVAVTAVLFIAAFIGIASFLAGLLVSSLNRARSRVQPFGPALAGAAVLTLFFYDPIVRTTAQYLGALGELIRQLV